MCMRLPLDHRFRPGGRGPVEVARAGAVPVGLVAALSSTRARAGAAPLKPFKAPRPGRYFPLNTPRRRGRGPVEVVARRPGHTGPPQPFHACGRGPVEAKERRNVPIKLVNTNLVPAPGAGAAPLKHLI